MDLPLPWERVLWSGSPTLPCRPRERYVLSDFRLVKSAGPEVEELLLRDIGEIHREESRLGRILGISTLHVCPRDSRRPSLTLRHVRRGQQIAAFVEWLANDPTGQRPRLDAKAVKAAISWSPQHATKDFIRAVPGLVAALVVIFGVVIGLHGKTAPASTYGADDPIAPGGHKKSEAEIVRYMERTIMPWARATLGSLKGGADRITCETCHGRDGGSRGWRMPAVVALPKPDLRDMGWEQYGATLDSQVRNAIYGYVAESDKQAKAAYMREVVLPGMADLLHRPAYDFTQPYWYNRSRLTFGCYHCHKVD